jgi:hypothetical protein
VSQDQRGQSSSSIYLQHLITIDRCGDSAVMCIPECFGDRYLCVNKMMYSKVRALFLSLQFRYCNELETPRSDYDAMPMLAFHKFVDAGVVIVRQTTGVMERIVSEQPSLRSSIIQCVRKNHLLRDSAYCVAHRVLSSFLAGRGSDAKTRLYVVLHLLCDAYAATVERIAALLVGSIEHEMLLTANADIDMRLVGVVKECVRLVGVDKTFLLGIIWHLRLSLESLWLDKDIVRLIEALRSAGCTIAAQEEMAVRCLLKEEPTVTTRYRIEAYRHYFQYMHCAEEYALLCLPHGIEWLNDLLFVFEGVQELIKSTLSDLVVNHRRPDGILPQDGGGAGG